RGGIQSARGGKKDAKEREAIERSRQRAGRQTMRINCALPFVIFAASLSAADTSKEVTFSRDVAPIFQRSCDNCHRPGSIAPMSLLTYKDARPWARSIREKVVRRVMPPWHIDRNIGITKFKDDPSLSDAQIATIAAWVDRGAVEGNPVDMPPLPHFT